MAIPTREKNPCALTIEKLAVKITKGHLLKMVVAVQMILRESERERVRKSSANWLVFNINPSLQT